MTVHDAEHGQGAEGGNNGCCIRKALSLLRLHAGIHWPLASAGIQFNHQPGEAGTDAILFFLPQVAKILGLLSHVKEN